MSETQQSPDNTSDQKRTVEFVESPREFIQEVLHMTGKPGSSVDDQVRAQWREEELSKKRHAQRMFLLTSQELIQGCGVEENNDKARHFTYVRNTAETLHDILTRNEFRVVSPRGEKVVIVKIGSGEHERDYTFEPIE